MAKGVNDHKKGNRTNSRRNTTKIQEYNRRYSEEIDGYKQFAQNRRENRTFRQQDVAKYRERLFSYIERCIEEETPITVAGMLLAMEVDHTSWGKMLAGEYDYRLYEYIDVNNISDDDIFIDENGCQTVTGANGETVLLIPYSVIAEKAMLMKEDMDERRLLEKGRVADIFNMKAMHGWQDDGTQPQTVNQTLVIASPEQAREAIKLLG